MKSPIKDKDAPLRLPGQSGEKHRNDLIDGVLPEYFAVVTLWIIAAVEAFSAWRRLPRMPWVFVALATVGTVFIFFRVIRLRRKSENLKLGIQGERLVAQLLGTLKVSELHVFHDVPAEGFNLDHVVVCDRGIFAVETKTWRKRADSRLVPRNGQLIKDGVPLTKKDPIRQAMSQADWLRERLRKMTGREFRCQPILAITGWEVAYMDDATKAMAWVLNPKAVLKWIEKDWNRMKPEDVNLVADCLAVHIRGSGEE